MNSSATKPPTIRPDFDTDVLWKPLRLGNRSRTISMDSNEEPSSDSRRTSFGEGMANPEVAPRTRKLSFTEMILGVPGRGGFSWGQGNLATGEKKASITDDERFKELLKRESMILNDEGTFSRKNYMK